ncbi:MAG: Fic family protein [Leptospirales bacterium]
MSHLVFAMKHESIDLAIIACLFRKIDKDQVQKFVCENHKGIYERKIGFLYEFMRGESLDIPKITIGNYVDILDPKEYFTSKAIKNKKWRINDNFIGFKDFCPIVRRTPILEEFIKKDLGKKILDVMKAYPSSIILRANQYLYIKETKSSFLIEREEATGGKIQRFIQLLHRNNGFSEMKKEDFVRIQNMIVDARFIASDYRSDQNYIGSRLENGMEIVHYIPPSSSSVASMMDGLIGTMNRTNGDVHPIIRAACVSFGFVFIHPFNDGNGRLHRFLIHEILSKEGFIPDNAIFPVSAHILNNMGEYDLCLESFSKKIMAVSQYSIDPEGILTRQNDTDFLYRFFDATPMTEYLFKVIEKTIEVDIPKELDFIGKYDKMKKAMQDLVDMPDKKIDLFIQMCRQNDGILSDSKKEKLFGMLSDEEIKDLEDIVNHFLPPEKGKKDDSEEDPGFHP